MLYMVFGLIAPCVLFASYFTVWVGRACRMEHLICVRAAILLAPLAFSCCGLDVIFVSAMAGVLEMNLPTQWIVEQNAHVLCEHIKQVTGAGCMHIAGVFPTGAYTLLAATLSSYFIFFCTIKVYGHPAITNMLWVLHSDGKR